MARDKHSEQDRPRLRDVQQAYGRYSGTEQGDRRRAREQPVADAAPGPAAPGQEAERGVHDPDHEYRRYERQDRQPKAQPKGARNLGKRLSELS